MSRIKKTVIGYLTVVSIVFLMGYVVFGIREMGLYLFLVLINLPGSLAVFPQMESLSGSLGWDLGRPPHILSTQLVSMAVNALLLTAIAAVAAQILRALKRDGRRW